MNFKFYTSVANRLKLLIGGGDLFVLPILNRFKGKLINLTEENGKKNNFEPDFGLFGPNLVPKFFSVNFTFTRCHTLLQIIIVCNFKKFTNLKNLRNFRK